jgi:hypothetical protein
VGAGWRSEPRGADIDPARADSIGNQQGPPSTEVDSLNLVGADGAIAVRVINPQVQDAAMRERNGQHVVTH